jgi:predicted dehydrogenase
MAVAAEGGRKVRIGVAGLGWIAQQAFLPAVAQTGNTRLAALVTGDTEKARVLGARYGVPRVLDYDAYDGLLESGEIDAVYIALPNSLHRDYAERALDAGVHVLCEKPMAPTEEDCQAMIKASEVSGARLMIAYRLHFEPATLAVLDLVEAGRLGEVLAFTSTFAQHVSAANTRAKARYWAGPLPDMGPYPINMARHVFRAEPEEVAALAVGGGRDGFAEGVPETVAASLRFPGGRLAQFTVSYAAEAVDEYRILGRRAVLHADPGYRFDCALAFRLSEGERTERHDFPRTDQFGGELRYFSDCILSGRPIEPDGREGLADIRVIRALQEAAWSGRPQRLPAAPSAPADLSPAQAANLPPVAESALVHAAPPPG